MTSKISFSKLVRAELKQLTWLLALQAVLFTLLIPFRVLMHMSMLSGKQENGMEIDMFGAFCRDIGFGRFENVLVVMVLGGICAICAFSYLHAQAKLDFYHSLPIRRDALFAVKYLASVLTFVLPYLTAQLLGLAVGAFYGVMSLQVAAEMAVCSVQMILFFLTSYAGTLVAVMLTGKLLTTVLAVGVFGCYIPMLLFLFFYFLATFLSAWHAQGWFFATSLRGLLAYTSPWAFCVFWGNGSEVGKTGLTGRWPSAAGLCQLVAIAALLSLLSLLLYRKRKTEAAGNALTFTKLESVIKIMLAVPVSLIAAIIADNMLNSVIWNAVFIVLFGVLFCMLMEFIYRWDIRQVLMHKWHAALSVALALLTFFGFQYDIVGYNTYLPEKSEVVGMAVKDGYCQWEYPVEGATGNYSDQAMRKILDYLETDQVELLYEIAENGVENQKAVRGKSESYLENTVWLYVKYHLKNGKEVYRNYAVDSDLYVRCMEQLLQETSYRERMYPILTWDGSNVVEISGSFYQGTIPQLFLQSNEAGQNATAAEEMDGDAEYASDYDVGNANYLDLTVPARKIEEVLAAYQEDLRSLPFEKINEAGPCLYFQTREQLGVGWYSNGYPFNGNFAHTLKLLKEIADTNR